MSLNAQYVINRVESDYYFSVLSVESTEIAGFEDTLLVRGK
jgi:hypothetical protein